MDSNQDFNPRSPHGERPPRRARGWPAFHFNPRSPHGERRRAKFASQSRSRFQSTLPARGATAFPARRCSFLSISIHAPRTGSDAFRNVPNARVIISIHAPRTGSDTPARLVFCLRFSFQSTLPARGATRRRSDTARIQIKFQSTLPARGATISLFGAFVKPTISIHAPRTGSDKRDR